MQQFWIKFLIILSTTISAQSALAVSLSALLNVNQATPSLLVDNSAFSVLVIDESIINSTIHHANFNDTSLSSNLSDLLQQKAFIQYFSGLKLSINLNNEYHVALNILWVNAAYRQSFQLQKCVYNAIKGQQHSCFQGQVSYQAERQKIALHLS